MNFSEAIKAIRAGKRVTYPELGNDSFIALYCGGVGIYHKVYSCRLWSPNVVAIDSEKWEILEEEAPVELKEMGFVEAMEAIRQGKKVQRRESGAGFLALDDTGKVCLFGYSQRWISVWSPHVSDMTATTWIILPY